MNGIFNIARRQASSSGGAAPVSPDFIFTVDTTKAGVSASDSIELPLLGGGTYTNLTVDWGDGNSQTLDFANRTHTYAAGGVYTITISGDRLNRFRFNNSGDKLKITNVSNWGIFETDVNNSFFGCSNLTITATDQPTFTSSGPSGFFIDCSSLNSPIDYDLAASTSVRSFLQGASSFNSTLRLSGASVTDAVSFIQGCTAFDHPSITSLDVSGWQNFNNALRSVNLTNSLASWDITSMTSATYFMLGGGMSTAAYDATLIGWEATLQAAFPNGSGYTPLINISFGSSQFTSGSAAATAKNSLVTNFGWTISDGGAV